MYIVVVYISDISPPFLVLNLTIYVFKKEIYFRILLDSVISFLLLLLKRDIFFSNAISSQSSNNQNLNKKIMPSKLGNPNLRVPKKSVSKNPARYGQPQKRRAMKRLKFCWMRLRSDGRDASPQRLPRGVVYGDPRWSNPD